MAGAMLNYDLVEQTVAVDLAAEAKKAKEMKTQGLNPDGTPYVHLPGMDAPPPTAMKRNPVTGEMEEFHSEALKVSGPLDMAYIQLAVRFVRLASVLACTCLHTHPPMAVLYWQNWHSLTWNRPFLLLL